MQTLKNTTTAINRALILATILIFVTASHASELVNIKAIQNGDLIFQSSTSRQSLAIQLATNSIYNHMGIIFFRKGKPYVLEAISKVAYTPLRAWIKRGIPSSYKVMRLKNAKQILTPTKLKRLRLSSEKMLGKPYDTAFNWSDKRIYCSELVWKAYHRAIKIKISELKKLKSFNLYNPIVYYNIRQRYGNKIPYNALVITPADMIQSKLLVPVKTR